MLTIFVLSPVPYKNKFLTALKTKSLDRRSGLSLVDYRFEISNLDLMEDLLKVMNYLRFQLFGKTGYTDHHCQDGSVALITQNFNNY
jgi:hypothetical protein